MNLNLLPQFDQWNKKKKELHTQLFTDDLFFNEGDIWWCSVGLNVGKEAFGKGKTFRRPVLIIRKLTNELCIVLPLSSVKKEGSWFVEVDLLDEKRYVMLNQIRMHDKKRFQRKISQISRADFFRVKEKLEALLELSQYHHPAFAGIEGTKSQSNISISEEEMESINTSFCPVCAQNEPFIAEYFKYPENA